MSRAPPACLPVRPPSNSAGSPAAAGNYAGSQLLRAAANAFWVQEPRNRNTCFVVRGSHSLPLLHRMWCIGAVRDAAWGGIVLCLVQSTPWYAPPEDIGRWILLPDIIVRQDD
jgi:hypothetical protein